MTTPRSLGGLEEPTPSPAPSSVRRDRSPRLLRAAWTLENPLDWAFFCCRLPDEGAEEIYSRGADILIAGQFGRPLKATSTNGGYRIFVEPRSSATVYDADWILSTVLVDEDESAEDEREMRMVYFPSEECAIIDTWDVMGMRGTGSNDISVTDVYVPKSRTFPMVPTSSPDPTIAARCIDSRSWACWRLASRRRCWGWRDDSRRGDRTRPTEDPGGMSGLLKERASAQSTWAERKRSCAQVACCFFDTLSEAWQRCLDGETHSLEQKADLLLAMAHAMSSAVQTVELASPSRGLYGVSNLQPVGTLLPDVQTMRHHVSTPPCAR